METIDQRLAHMFSQLSIVTRDVRELEARKKRLEDFVEFLETYDWNALEPRFPGAYGIKKRLEALQADKKAADFLKGE